MKRNLIIGAAAGLAVGVTAAFPVVAAALTSVGLGFLGGTLFTVPLLLASVIYGLYSIFRQHHENDVADVMLAWGVGLAGIIPAIFALGNPVLLPGASLLAIAYKLVPFAIGGMAIASGVERFSNWRNSTPNGPA